MNRVVHFEIATKDLGRAAKFYKDIFGWKIEKVKMGAGDYWMIDTGKEKIGINGGITKGSPVYEQPLAYICTIDVKNIDEFLKKIKSMGGEIIKPKMAIPKVGWLAYAKDTEGNIFGIMEADKKAANTEKEMEMEMMSEW